MLAPYTLEISKIQWETDGSTEVDTKNSRPRSRIMSPLKGCLDDTHLPLESINLEVNVLWRFILLV